MKMSCQLFKYHVPTGNYINIPKATHDYRIFEPRQDNGNIDQGLDICLWLQNTELLIELYQCGRDILGIK